MKIGFQSVINYIKKNNLDSMDKDIYEFGVCTGGGTRQMFEFLTENKIQFDKYFGFDSWHGLPKETKGLWNPDQWKIGAFDATVFLNKPEDEVIAYLKESLGEITDRPIDFISGFFEKTLTTDLLIEKGFKPALFISIDVDIHKSAYQALNYMAKNKLIIKGTIIRYDEWGDFNDPTWEGDEEFAFGESLAHKQICEKYDYKFEEIHNEQGVKILALK